MKIRRSLPVVFIASVFLSTGCTLELPEQDVSMSEQALVPPPCEIDVAASAAPEDEPICGFCGDGFCHPFEVGACPQDCHVQPDIIWSNWLDRDDPSGTGDWETRVDFSISQVGCASPVDVQAQTTSGVPASSTGQILSISPSVGLICNNANQSSGTCLDYRVRFACPAP